jgi:hypothetical protein
MPFKEEEEKQKILETQESETKPFRLVSFSTITFLFVLFIIILIELRISISSSVAIIIALSYILIILFGLFSIIKPKLKKAKNNNLENIEKVSALSPYEKYQECEKTIDKYKKRLCIIFLILLTPLATPLHALLFCDGALGSGIHCEASFYSSLLEQLTGVWEMSHIIIIGLFWTFAILFWIPLLILHALINIFIEYKKMNKY